MKLLYYSADVSAKQAAIQEVLAGSGADIELVPVSEEREFVRMLPEANILIIQEKEFDRLLLQIIADAEKAPNKRKLALLKEPKHFDADTVSLILKQLYTNPVSLRFPVKNGEIELTDKEIFYFEYADRFVYMKTREDYIKTTLKLKEIPGMMEGSCFCSPYVSFVVNLMYVETVTGNTVVLKNGEKIPLSQKKAADFRRAYKRYLSIMS